MSTRRSILSKLESSCLKKREGKKYNTNMELDQILLSGKNNGLKDTLKLNSHLALSVNQSEKVRANTLIVY